uniref:Uncharacterized protein n=1 Tax=Nelumbo nucifera TaxID=4432 RepID=A0A822YBG6_NELNU|nr:TPA_asm: hypothetical protein HUJ06_031245 [Nelumbo nucifera]
MFNHNDNEYFKYWYLMIMLIKITAYCEVLIFFGVILKICASKTDKKHEHVPEGVRFLGCNLLSTRKGDFCCNGAEKYYQDISCSKKKRPF